MSLDYLKLLHGLRPTRKQFAAGDMLVRAGDKVAAIYAVEKGRIALSRGGVVVHRALPGALFGESGLFADVNPYDGHAETGATVLLYPQAALLLYLRAHPDINLAFSAFLAHGLDAARLRLELASIRSAPQRVRAYFHQLGAGDDWVELDRPLMRAAADLGLSHEAFYRSLRKLVDSGEMQRRGRRGFLLKPITAGQEQASAR